MINAKQRTLKVVIVDDSPLIVVRLEQMLDGLERIKLLGHASNIGSGFALIRDTVPDVVILDIYLEEDAPEANGLTLLAVLTKEFADIQVIMLTNLFDQQYKSKCMKTGAKYFLDKSNEFEKIPEILIDIIETLK